MAQFAIYQYLFDKLNKYDQELPFEEYSVEEDKQDIFDRFFSEDYDLHFKVGDKPEFQHVRIPFPLNDKIYFLRIGNNKRLKFDQFHEDTNNFMTDAQEYNPNCYVIIDNRKDVQRIAIQVKHSSFGSPNQVAKILQVVFSELLKPYNLSIEINPKMHSDEFFHVVRLHKGKFAKARFDYAHPNLPVISDMISELEKTAEETNSDPSLELNQKLSGEPIVISEKSDRIRRYATASAAQGRPITLISLDGIRYDIFVVDEKNTDATKQVILPLDSQVLVNLDDPDLSESAKGHILEFMNGLKVAYQ